MTKSESLEFRQEYEVGCTIAEIAEKHGRGMETVWRRLQETGGTRTTGEVLSARMKSGKIPKPPVNRVHFFNEDVFAGALTPQKAWLLGLIFANGSVRPQGRVQVACGSDKDLAEKVAAVIGYDGAPYFVRNCWITEVSSVKTVADLGSWGVVKAKTNIMVFPKINPVLLSHFVRGAWEGDGTVYWHSTQKRLGTHYSSNSRAFIEPMRDVVAKKTGKFAKISESPRDACLRIAYGGRSAELVLEWLYSKSEPGMRSDRKYCKFQTHRRV